MTNFDPAVFDSTLVAGRVEEFRKSLLDTSLRNRLINFRARNRAGKSLDKVIEVYDEKLDDILQRLVIEGKAMAFTGRPDAGKLRSGIEQSNAEDPVSSLFENSQELDRSAQTAENDETETEDSGNKKLGTREYESVLQRKLTKIARDAKLSLEEQGVNVLYLALGMLEWYEHDKSEVLRRAPLILLPVSLDRTAKGAFRLRWDGSEVGANLSISAKLGAEFGLVFPEFPEVVEVSAYCASVASHIHHLPRWQVDENAIALAFFSYAKFIVFEDFDSANWPNGNKPGEHATLGALLDCGFAEHEEGISEDVFLDPLRIPGDTCEIYDADSSQSLAILEANSGRTMLIEGPPGTGKSQTYLSNNARKRLRPGGTEVHLLGTLGNQGG